ncbi:MAG: site-specific DNA-methyltransferase [Chloroflexi bacterium]|nr:site-specific DNA-methyltransferase [Chloroflexota bacterium]
MNIPTDRDQVYVDELRERIPFSPEPAGTEGPRLSWRRGAGAQRIETDAMPLYIHEKVSPAAFVEQISKEATAAGQGTFFDDFNGFPPDARYDWYRHEGNWQNRIIRGNSAEVMASLAQKEGMAGQVQLVYFDPPYGIGFDSNYQGSTRKRTENRAPVESASRRAFRDTYVDGLHSYMDTVFRIAVHARELLRDSGSFFLQIGTENVHRLSVVLDEVFGPENRVATVAFAKSGAKPTTHLSQVADWLLWYAKNKDLVTFHQVFERLTRRDVVEFMSSYAMVELADGSCRNLTSEEKEHPDLRLPSGARILKRERLASQGESDDRSAPYIWNDTEYPCPPGRHWTVDRDGLDRLAASNRLVAPPSGGTLGWKRYEDEIPGREIHNLWRSYQKPSDMHYVVETAEKTIERCLLMATNPGDLVLDPTCGSGTTALVAERWGRRWITIDASTIPVALCRQRVLSSVHKWFLTQDDPEGRKEEAKLAGRLDDYVSDTGLDVSGGQNDPGSGFVYERVPYVSAAHLAYERPPKATLLVDRPVAKRGVKRITSPFTVESHSPWLYVSPSEEAAGERGTSETEGRDNERETAIRENVVHALAVAGIEAPDFGGGAAAQRWRLDGIELSEDAAPAVFLTHEATLRVVGKKEQAHAGPSVGTPGGTGERVAIATVPDDHTATAQLIDDAALVAARLRQASGRGLSLRRPR